MKRMMISGMLFSVMAFTPLTSPATPPATQKLMDAKISLFDLFIQGMEDGLDAARLTVENEDVPLLWGIEYDSDRDLLVFTFTRTLEGKDLQDFLKMTAEQRKSRMSDSLDALAPIVGLSPIEGFDTPMGLLQVAPVRAGTDDLKAAAEAMRGEMFERAVITLVWSADKLGCIAARASGSTETKYTETTTQKKEEKTFWWRPSDKQE